MSLESFAQHELERAGLFDKDSDYGGMLGDAVMRMVRLFADEGHSGFSAGMAVQIFGRLARYEPLSPLTGSDDEWTEVGDGIFQNRRSPRVFKEASGAYDMEGRVFREPSGVCFTSRDSRVPVTFPYTPSTEYVDVDGSDAN